MKVWVCYYQFCDDTNVEGITTSEEIAKDWLQERQSRHHRYYRYSYEELETDAFRDYAE